MALTNATAFPHRRPSRPARSVRENSCPATGLHLHLHAIRGQDCAAGLLQSFQIPHTALPTFMPALAAAPDTAPLCVLHFFTMLTKPILIAVAQYSHMFCLLFFASAAAAAADWERSGSNSPAGSISKAKIGLLQLFCPRSVNILHVTSAGVLTMPSHPVNLWKVLQQIQFEENMTIDPARPSEFRVLQLMSVVCDALWLTAVTPTGTAFRLTHVYQMHLFNKLCHVLVIITRSCSGSPMQTRLCCVDLHVT